MLDISCRCKGVVEWLQAGAICSAFAPSPSHHSACVRQKKRLGISQEELAYRVQVHRTFVGSIERAETNIISTDNISRISDALGVETAQLMCGAGGKPAN